VIAPPLDVSADGWKIDRLIEFAAIATGILFAIVVGWIVIACVRHRSGRHAAVYSQGDSRREVVAVLAIAAVVFLAVDGTLFVRSSIDLGDTFWNYARADSDPDAVRIEINAHQWAWDARYAGDDGVFATDDDILALGDIRVPIGAPIVFQLASVDVVHSFSLPNLRVKQDVIPGTVTKLWLRATQPGAFDISCSQHCGVGHYKMKGQLIVMPRADYDAWRARAQSLARTAYDPEDADAHWGWPWAQEMQ
jgi:cytochrome c oxidase subunit 2